MPIYKNRLRLRNLIIVMIILGIIITLFAINEKDEVAHPVFNEYEEVITENHYSAYLANHPDNYHNTNEKYSFPVTSIILDENEEINLTDEYYEWPDNKSIKIQATIQKSGLYLIYLNYSTLSNTHIPIGLSVEINDQIPYYEASQIVLDTLWKEASQELATDRYGNDVSVMQKVHHKWQNIPLKDAGNLYHQGLQFYLEAGMNEISIIKTSGELRIKDITIAAFEEAVSYTEYLKQHPDQNHQFIKRFEAEEMCYKNSSAINRGTSRDVNVLPFSKTKLKLNVIGVDSYQNPGDAVTWAADIEEAGYYYLTFKVNQGRQYSTSYRTLLINGKIPFQEAEHLAFSYQKEWQNVTLQSLDYQPYLFYLEPQDEITLTVDSSLFINVSEKIRHLTQEMTELGLDVTKLTRNNVDKNIDWEMLDYFPDLNETLDKWINELEKIVYHLRLLSGFSKDSKIIKDVIVAQDKIKIISQNINELPRRLTLLSTGSSSAVQLLSNQIDNILIQPMVVDAFYIHRGDEFLPRANGSFWAKSKLAISRFFLSFFDKSYREKAQPDELEVWVNRSRQYVDLIQKISDDVFTKETGIKVKVSIMNNDGKLLLANSANQQPDVALGVSAWIPSDYGMRGMLYDLSQATGFKETISIYHPEQLVPMIYDNQLYGLPETENFYVLLYRKDILSRLDLEVPNTWDDVLAMLPVLERYGMNFYLPLSNSNAFKSFDATAPFIFQFNGELYSKDGFSAAVDHEGTIKALNFMSDLYREYSIPYQVPSFFNSFRYGTIPIGIADFGTYLQLINAAAELRGLWDIALVPGVPDEDGNINRSMPGAQQAGIIFEKSEMKNEAWKFLSWWMSTDIQTVYANMLINTLGTRYLWNSANIEAFGNFNWNENHQQIILSQWEHLKEVPKIPGSYIIEREISNTLNAVIFNDANLRSTISDAILKMNKEINRKMQEFKYIDDRGQIIKPFDVPSIKTVRRWLEDEQD